MRSLEKYQRRPTFNLFLPCEQRHAGTLPLLKTEKLGSVDKLFGCRMPCRLEPCGLKYPRELAANEPDHGRC